MNTSQLLLFDESQPDCAHCGASIPAFEDQSHKYCSKACRDDFNRLLRKEIRNTVDKVPTSLYKYYDCDGILLYVGITSRGSARNGEHNKSKSWWQFVDRQTVEHHRSRASAEQRETTLIRKYAPPFNKQQNPDHKAARDAYFLRQSIGGAKGVKLLAEGKNRVPGFVINKVGDRVTIMVSNPLVIFADPAKIVIDSGGRRAKFLDSGVFSDNSGSWARVATPKPEAVKGAIVMYRHHVKSSWLYVKSIQLIYQEDGLVNVWDHNWKKRLR